MRFGLAALASALALAACIEPPPVVRVVDGRTSEGRFVAPESYELFLRGEIALDAGEPLHAIAAFEALSISDPLDALVWWKLASALCLDNVHDARISRALDRALALEPQLRGADPAISPCRRVALAAGAVADASSEATGRDRLLGAALADGATLSWQAVRAWAAAHGDDGLEVLAAKRLAGRSDASTLELAARASATAGQGRVALARAIAAAVVDAPGEALRPAHREVARLAIDEALARGDESLASKRAARGATSLTDVAARALAMGRYSIATKLAELVRLADPADVDARMVLLAAGAAASDPLALALSIADFGEVARTAGFAANLVFIMTIVRIAPDSAKLLPRLQLRGGLDGRDALLVPIAAELADLGVVDKAELRAAIASDPLGARPAAQVAPRD